METTTGIKATVKRITTGRIYRVTNIIDATRAGKGICHRGDFFIASILVNGKCKGRSFYMNRNEFEIIELISEEQLPLFTEN